MPFWSLVRLLLKLAIAAIPALVILGAVAMVFGFLIVLGTLGASLGLPK